MEKKLRSKSDKSGLVLPGSRVHSRMKKAMGPKGRVSSTSPIYLCAVLETIGTEILASAGKFTRDAGRQRISPEDLIAGIRGDDDLSRLFDKTGVRIDTELKGILAATKATVKE